MRSELENIEKIEQYLTGKLTQEAKAAFEAEIKVNSELKEQVETQKEIMDRIKVNAFREEVKGYHQANYDSNGPSGKPPVRTVFAVIVLLVVGALAGIYFWPEGEETKVHSITELQEVNPATTEETGNVETDVETLAQDESLKTTEVSTSNVKKTPFKIPDAFIVPFEVFEIDAQKGGTIKSSASNSTIRIPANSLVDKNGKLVKGKVLIQLREFRNSAQTAFSMIPMTHTMKGEEYNFNSAGMFEIRGKQNGEELGVKKGENISVDYEATEQLRGLNFYRLEDKTQKWNKLTEIEFDTLISREELELWQNKEKASDGGGIYVGENIPTEETEIHSMVVQQAEYPGGEQALMNYLNKRLIYPSSAINQGICGRVTVQFLVTATGDVNDIVILRGTNTILDTAAAYAVSQIKGMSPAKQQGNNVASYYTVPLTFKIHDDLGNVVDCAGDLKLQNGNKDPKVTELRNAKIPWWNGKGKAISTSAKSANSQQEEYVMDDNGDRTAGAMLAEGMGAGHTYPNLVKGLQAPDFGVYNCDQIYRVRKRVNIIADYLTEEGKPIMNATVLSMIDLNYNGAFSFAPRNFTCSSIGKNVLLVFTRDHSLYILDAKSFAKMGIKEDGIYTFVLTDITDKVKNTNDLENYLGLAGPSSF